MNAFRAFLAAKGLTLKTDPATELQEGECEMAWTKAKGKTAGFGSLACLDRDLGGG